MEPLAKERNHIARAATIGTPRKASMEPLAKERNHYRWAVRAGLIERPQWSRSPRSGITPADPRRHLPVRHASMEPLAKERNHGVEDEGGSR